MPAIGSTLKNAHGIEWLVDGHTSAPSILRWEDGDQEELYPLIIPQNLSKRLTEFAAEIDRCTSKVLVPIDTMPLMFPKRGHPGGHWVDAWSDPYRILLFLDAAHIHETVLAHELAHVWIDLVRGIEDYRVLKDKSNSARYAHVQFIQSFILDIPVDQVLKDKGFDLSVIDRDAGSALKNLAESTSCGYCPPSKREAAFLGSFLATSILAVEEHEPGIVRYQDSLLAIRPHLPEVYALGERLESAIRDNPPVSREAVRLAVDAALKESFEFCDENLDIDKELFEVAPEVAWSEDKHPEWLSGLSPKAKCEIGVAMAVAGANSTARYELSYAPSGKVRVRFEHDDGGLTEYAELAHVTTVPGAPNPAATNISSPQIAGAIAQNERNRRRLEDMVSQPKTGPSCQAPHPALLNVMPIFPGQRSYSTGLARWITQVRLEEQLAGEHPYAYANNNPVTYIDPTGEVPQRRGQKSVGTGREGPCDVYICYEYGFGFPPPYYPPLPTHEYVCVTGPNGGCAGGLYPGTGVGDQTLGCKSQTSPFPIHCDRLTNRTPVGVKCDIAQAVCECMRIMTAKPPNYWTAPLCYGFTRDVLDCAVGRLSGAGKSYLLQILDFRV